jgi:CCR4-NOT transcription complex subunit 7/8
MRCNVDLLKIIQLGITLADEEGQFPQECSTWQFNFRFSLSYVQFTQQVFLLLFSYQSFFEFSEDMYPPESVEQLQKAGIEFQKHEEYGIFPNDFAELMITSGLVLAPETKWISFHR